MRLAVCGGKGGCGKTTTALALAGALVAARRAPIVVDCDRDLPNLHVYAETGDAPGVDALASGLDVEDATHDASQPAGVRVVPGTSGSDVAGALTELDERAVDGALFLDAPAGASEDVALPLRFATGSVLVTTRSTPCVRAAVKTAAMARALDAPPVAVVVSRAPRIPSGLPQTLGVPRERIVAVPTLEDPLLSDGCRALGRLCGLLRPNT